LNLICVILPCPIFPSANANERELEKSGCRVEDFQKIRKVMTQAFFPEQQQWRQIECRGFSPHFAWEKSSVSRISPRNPCLPAVIAAAKWFK